jgi:hypothetical protein
MKMKNNTMVTDPHVASFKKLFLEVARAVLKPSVSNTLHPPDSHNPYLALYLAAKRLYHGSGADPIYLPFDIPLPTNQLLQMSLSSSKAPTTRTVRSTGLRRRRS